PRRDIAGADRPELARSLDFEVQPGGADLAPGASTESVSSLSSAGAVERGGLVVDGQPVEVEVGRQDVKRAGAVDAEELVVRARLVEAVLVDDHELGPEGRDRPVPDPDDTGTAVEGATHVGEVRYPHQSLGAEQELLPTTAQRDAGLLAEWNDDVGEAVLQIELVDEARRPASGELSVERERALPF